MHFLNLSLLEFSALLGATVAIVTALYLLDKNRQRRVVSTLRFWHEVEESTPVRNRARVEQPWSLLLQLLALTLLMLALAGITWNSGRRAPRGHVLIIDTSSPTAGILPDEKRLAKEYLSRLSPVDAVMLIDASGLVVPRTGFTAVREQTRQAVDALRSSDTALAVERTLNAARQSLQSAPGVPGEIVYIGPARIPEGSDASAGNLRFLKVDAPPGRPHIIAMAARAGSEPGTWKASVQVRNGARSPATVRLRTSFGVSDFATRELSLPPGVTRREDYDFRVTAPGTLRAWTEESGSDSAANPAAVLALPRNAPVEVLAYSNRAPELRTLLAADPRIHVRFASTGAYNPDSAGADMVVLDEFVPGHQPRQPSLWINPPTVGQPAPFPKAGAEIAVTAWTPDPKLGLGLQSHDLRLRQARVLTKGNGEIAVASISAGPVAVADPAKHEVILGFDPVAAPARLSVASPLLIANAVRWLAPDAFSAREASCGQVGAAVLALPEEARAETVRVSTASQAPVPFVVRAHTVEFYVDRPASIAVQAGAWERKLSLTLPQDASADWTPAGVASTVLPQRHALAAGATDLWRILSIAAAALMLADWLLFERRPHRLGVALRFATAAALIAAWLAPVIHVPTAKTATVALVDTSRPMDRSDLARLTARLKELAAQRGRNRLLVVPFAESGEGAAKLEAVSSRPRSEADLEEALTASVAAAPEGYRPRVLLFTNGQEGHGSAARAVAALQRVGVPVDTTPLLTRAGASDAGPLRIASFIAPQAGFSGELLPLEVVVNAPREADAHLQILADGKPLGEQPVKLRRGRNEIRSEARVNSSAAAVITAAVKSDLGDSSMDAVVQLSPAHLLYYSQDLPGTEENFLALIKRAGFELNSDSRALDGDLSANQVIVLNNVDTDALPLSQKTALSNFVENGGGLLLIGGERQVYKEDKQLDALDRVLPAKLAPPRNPEGKCVALIIDKSSSMEGRKIDLARLSAIGVVDHLTPRDNIGVLMFDNSFSWAVPMRKAVDKETIKTLISGITPDGGTQISPALTEAYRRVLRSDSTYKHIVLLTDGISEEGDSLELAGQALTHHVTISTVGLGQDVNRSYLERIALLSGGKSYFLNNPQGLQQILLKDVQDYTGSTTVEKPLAAMVKTKAELLDGVDMEHAPPLKGYARFQSKPDAETLLTIDAEKRDPLFVRWQYGLGRAAIFASDAKSRWAEAWMTWPGYDKFWVNVLRDLATRNNQTEAQADFDAANDTIHVRYLLPVEAKLRKLPDFFVLGPSGFARTFKLNETSPGVFEARIEIGGRTGTFRIRPLTASALLPEIGLVRQNAAEPGGQLDEPLLRSIAAQTGGRYDPPFREAFDAGQPASRIPIPLWPGLLLLVVILDVCELALRRRGGLIRLLRFRPAAWPWNGLRWSA